MFFQGGIIQGGLMLYTKQEPEVGAWYTNRTGKLMKVKLVLYRHENPLRVMIEFLEGQHKIVNIDDWYYLELSRQIGAYRKARLQQ